MSASAVLVVMNIVLAALFAASHLTIAWLYPSRRAPLWFAASYAVGLLTPIARLGLAAGAGTPSLWMVAFFSFSAALVLMVSALSVFYCSRLPKRTIGALAAVTFAAAVGLLQFDRNTLAYAMTYQSPFLLASWACVWVVLRDSPRRANDLVLAGLFGLIALHFPVKAFLAAHLGTGIDPRGYVTSPYALVSQLSTGMLFAATGFALLITTVLRVVREAQEAAETDPLSGALNRRGFEERAARLLAGEPHQSLPAALLVLDIDHFKRINDSGGHAAGDRAIRWFAGLLAHVAPRAAVIGRLGGEEFVILLARTNRETGRLVAEAIRQATLDRPDADVPAMTVSIGVTDIRPGDLLHTALERADAALYAAKHAGRNQVCLAPEAADAGPGKDNVIVLRRGGDA
ncbi:GGDEF domain-containing protein [Xanthobacter sp. AM11]|uniref:GGDEF domain-containing protein n=1 Tax=Xanthobacter sp. AM11 TaxID=3380643 RepID=UPI0039BFD198